jgi:hypothetical protein
VAIPLEIRVLRAGRALLVADVLPDGQGDGERRGGEQPAGDRPGQISRTWTLDMVSLRA